MLVPIKYYKFNLWIFLGVISLLGIIVFWITNNLVLTDNFYYTELGSRLNVKEISRFLEVNKNIQWVGYLLIPVSLLLKWTILSGIIYIGLYYFNEEISFKDCFKIIQFSELILIVAGLIKIIWIYYKPTSLENIQFFYPLSIITFFSVKSVPTYLVYPLQQLNLFEIGYWLLLSNGICAHIKKPLRSGLKITAFSYGIAFSIWVLFVVFIQLQFGQ
jgi:hypothetical protein